MLEWSRELLYHSTQPVVANSTSARVLYGPSWKTAVPMHSVLYRPMIDSIRALS